MRKAQLSMVASVALLASISHGEVVIARAAKAFDDCIRDHDCKASSNGRSTRGSRVAKRQQWRNSR
jgi:hypothetical protein